MNILNLLWIIPVSMLMGGVITILFCCLLASKITEQENEREENTNDD